MQPPSLPVVVPKNEFNHDADLCELSQSNALTASTLPPDGLRLVLDAPVWDRRSLQVADSLPETVTPEPDNASSFRLLLES